MTDRVLASEKPEASIPSPALPDVAFATKVRVSPRRALSNAFFGAMAITGIVGYVGNLVASSSALEPIFATFDAGLAAYLVYAALLTRSPRPVQIAASVEGLRIDGALVPRAGIATGWYVPSRPQDGALGAAHVMLEGDRPIRVDVGNEAQARALLAALGLDADQHAPRFPISHPLPQAWRRRLTGVTLAGIAPFAVSAALHSRPGYEVVAMVGVLILGVLVAAVLGRGHVHVGTDGVLVETRFRRQFVPIAEIDRVEERKTGELVLVTSAGDVSIDPDRRTKRGADTRPRAALRARVEAVLAGRAAGGVTAASAHVAKLLDRKRAPAREWLGSLAALGGVDYRAPTLQRDELVAVLHGARSPFARLGAAVVLARDAAERPQIRVAAGACASPKLRVALEAVADGRREDDVARAAADLESEQAPAEDDEPKAARVD